MSQPYSSDDDTERADCRRREPPCGIIGKHTHGDRAGTFVGEPDLPGEYTAEAAALIKALSDHDWRPELGDLGLSSAHNTHQYDGGCAVCRGDVKAMAAVLAPLVADLQAEARRGGWFDGVEDCVARHETGALIANRHPSAAKRAQRLRGGSHERG